MKKLLVSVFSAFITLNCLAQSISYGVKAGVNFSSQSLSGYAIYGGLSGSQSITGFNAGGVVDIGFGSFSIQPGLLYSTKGTKTPAHPNQNPADGPTDGPNVYTIPAATYNLKYIELPLNVIYSLPVSQALSIQLGAGPYIGYGISANVSVARGMASFNDDQTPGIHYKNPDLGANFLGDIEVQKRFLIDVQYSLGLSNVSNTNNEYPASDIKNRVLSISVGYLFR